MFEIATFAGDQVVQNANTLAPSHQSLDYVRTNKAGAAGNQIKILFSHL
jgi:hypothetical protein